MPGARRHERRVRPGHRRIRFGGRAAAGRGRDVEDVIGRGDAEPEGGVERGERLQRADVRRLVHGQAVDEGVDDPAGHDRADPAEVGVTDQDPALDVEVFQLIGPVGEVYGRAIDAFQDEPDLTIESFDFLLVG